jgi:hypothetical protein
MVGEFTGRFDREVLKEKLGEDDPELARLQRLEKEQQDLARGLEDLGAILAKRERFMLERFANASAEELSGHGFQLRFEGTDDRRRASFLMRARPNDSKLAIVVESRHEIEGEPNPSFDYVTLPVSQVDLDRARRFVEAKLMEFAKAYVG